MKIEYYLQLSITNRSPPPPILNARDLKLIFVFGFVKIIGVFFPQSKVCLTSEVTYCEELYPKSLWMPRRRCFSAGTPHTITSGTLLLITVARTTLLRDWKQAGKAVCQFTE